MNKILTVFLIGLVVGLAAGVFLSPLIIKKEQKPAVPTMESMQDKFNQVIADKIDQLNNDPTNPGLKIEIANSYFDTGKYEEAAIFYKSALESKPGDIMVMTDLGVCYRRLGQPDEAIKWFREAVNIKPDHTVAWYNIGVTSYYDKKDIQTASDALGRALKLDPFYKNAIALKSRIDKEKAGVK